MALGSSSKNVKVIPEAFQVMNQFKYEVATELGINPEYKTGYWGGNIPSRECGAVGGHMVRRMVAAAQQSLLGQGGGGPAATATGGFRGGSFPQEPPVQ